MSTTTTPGGEAVSAPHPVRPAPEDYDAFISYSHTADMRLAPALQNALKQFGKPWYRLRAVRTFRDQTNLAAAPGLWASIEIALSRSRHFILLVSRDAAASPWVAREIRYWLDHKSRDRLLLAVTDGEIVWDAEAGDFDWLRSSALPPVLRGVFTEEPRWVDLRGASAGGRVNTRDARFRDAVADLSAGIRGVSKDEIVGEDLRRHRQTMRLARATIAVLTVLAAAATTASVIAARQAERARAQSALATSRYLASTAREQLDTDPGRALLLSLAALRINDTPQARGALLGALQRSPHLRSVVTDSAAAGAFGFTADGTIRLLGWNGAVQSWSPTGVPGPGAQIADPAAVNSAAVTATADVGVIPSRNGVVVVDLGRPGEAVTLPDAGPGTYRSQVAVSNDGQLVVAATGEEVVLWRLNPARVLWRTPAAGVNALAFDGGRQLLVGGETTTGGKISGYVRRYAVADGRRTGADLIADTPVLSLSVSADGGYAVTRNEDDAGDFMMWWNLGTGAPLIDQIGGTNRFSEGGPFSAAELSPDGRLLATGSDTGEVIVWDGRDQSWLHSDMIGHAGAIVDFAFSPDSSTLLSLGLDGRIISWDLGPQLRLGEELYLANEQSGNSPPPVSHVVFGPDGRRLAASDLLGAASVWDLPSGNPMSTLQGATLPEELSFADADHLVLATSDEIDLWHAPSGHQLTQVVRVEDADSVAVAADGRTVAWADDNKIDLRDLDLKRDVRLEFGNECERVADVAFSADGRFAVAACGKALRAWRLDEHARLALDLGTPTETLGLVASRDGSLVAGYDSRTVWLLDVTSRQVRQLPLFGLTGAVSGLALSNDGRYLAISAQHDTTLLWSLDSDAQVPAVLRLGLPSNNPAGPAFSPDSRYLAVGTSYGVVLWDLDLDHWIHEACQIAGRSLSRAEWRQYVGDGFGYQELCPRGARSSVLAGRSPAPPASLTPQPERSDSQVGRTNVVFFDDFRDASTTWSLADDRSHRATIDADRGAYRTTVRDNTWWAFRSPSPPIDPTDIAVGAQARVVGRALTAGDGFGVWCGVLGQDAQSSSQYVLLQKSSTVALVKRSGGRDIRVEEVASSVSPGQPSNLELRCLVAPDGGVSLTGRADGRDVVSMRDTQDPLAVKEVGLYVTNESARTEPDPVDIEWGPFLVRGHPG